MWAIFDQFNRLPTQVFPENELKSFFIPFPSGYWESAGEVIFSFRTNENVRVSLTFGYHPQKNAALFPARRFQIDIAEV